MKLTEGQQKAYQKLLKKPLYMYGLFNFDHPFGVFYTIKQAKEEAISINHGEPWSETRKLFQIHPIKIIVSK
jgi:hypothetical protein